MNEVRCIQLALSLAASEAAAAGFAEITPAHLLIALCRLSESEASGPLGTGELRREFEQLGVDPRRFRRRMRVLVGRAGGSGPPEVLHRSAACRALFEQARATALREGVKLGPSLLLRTALRGLAGGGAPDAAAPRPAMDAPDDAIPNEL